MQLPESSVFLHGSVNSLVQQTSPEWNPVVAAFLSSVSSLGWIDICSHLFGGDLIQQMLTQKQGYSDYLSHMLRKKMPSQNRQSNIPGGAEMVKCTHCPSRGQSGHLKPPVTPSPGTSGMPGLSGHLQCPQMDTYI